MRVPVAYRAYGYTDPCLIGGPRVEVEYEHEVETVPFTKETLANW